MLFFSLFYSNKISLMIKETDDLYLYINDLKNEYDILPVDAVIDGDFIVPGISGSVVNVVKSYEKMKQGLYFDENLFIYDKLFGEVSLSNIYNKYIISGNRNFRNVSLVFVGDDKDIICSIIAILDNYGVVGNFFVSSEDLYYESEHLFNNSNMSFGNLFNFGGFCFTNKLDSDLLNKCSGYNRYTIYSPFVSYNYLQNVKETLNSGDIFSFEVKEDVLPNLGLIIEHINTKGLKIIGLDELIVE